MPGSIDIAMGRDRNRDSGGFQPLIDQDDAQSRVVKIMSVDAKTFLDVLTEACEAGIGVLLSPTGNAGAISITLYVGDERFRSYVTDSDEFTKALDVIRDRAGARLVGLAPPKPKGRRNGS